jgi:hypothetical protein
MLHWDASALIAKRCQRGHREGRAMEWNVQEALQEWLSRATAEARAQVDRSLHPPSDEESRRWAVRLATLYEIAGVCEQLGIAR